MRHEGLEQVRLRLEGIGFRRHKSLYFVRPMSGDTVGWLGLNQSKRYRPKGEIGIIAVVGVWHREIETVIANLIGQEVNEYLPPTYSLPLHGIIEGGRYPRWILLDEDDGDDREVLVDDIRATGIPFMESLTDLKTLCQALEPLSRIHTPYVRPVAWALLGDLDRAEEAILDNEVYLVGRDDPEAQQRRVFVAAFRERFLS